jgi:hypothetical protein
MNTKNKKSVFLTTLFATLLLFTLLTPFIGVHFFVFPVYDDYWYAEVVSNHGFLGALDWWRNNASGRFLATLIISISNYSVKSIFLHRLLLLLLSLFFVVSTWVLIKSILRSLLIISLWEIWFLFMIFLFCFVSSLPGISEVLYWLPGAATYILGISFINILISLLIKTKQKPTKISFLAIVLVSICACGTSEITGIFIIGLLFLTSFQLTKTENKSKNIFFSIYFYIFLGITFFLLVIVLKAPGNAIRFHLESRVNPEVGNSFFAFKSALLSTLKFIYNLFFIKRIFILTIPLSIWLLLVDVFPNQKFEFILKFKFKFLLSVQFFLILFTFLTFFSYSFSTGLWLPIQRIMSLIHYLWLLNFLLCVFLFSLWIKPWISNFVVISNGGFIISLIIFLTLFISAKQNNTSRLIIDMQNSNYSKYCIYMKKQRSFFQNGNEHLVKNQKPPSRPMIYVWDLADENYKTRYFEYYSNSLNKKSK